MTRACAYCGRPFEAKRPVARFCGATCRQRARRHPEVVGLPRPRVPADTELLDVVRRELHERGVFDSWPGWLAEKLAGAIVDPYCPPGSLAALSRELTSTLADARTCRPTAAEIAEIRDLRAGRNSR